jgi:hypothetical protein
MFSQWFLFLCSLLFVSSPVTNETTPDQVFCGNNLKLSRAQKPGNAYGWQVSEKTVSAVELYTN